MKRRSFLIRAVVCLLLGCALFFSSTLFHSTGHAGSTVVTLNELSRLVGASSISHNETTKVILNCVSYTLLILGVVLAFYAVHFLIKYLKTSNKVKGLLNKFFGGK